MAKKRSKVQGRVLLGVALLAALGVGVGYLCFHSSDQDAATAKKVELRNTQWQLVSLSGERPVDGGQFTLVFDEAGNVGGKSGCNGFSGGYQVAEKSLTIVTPLVATEMACQAHVMRQEKAFLEILGKGEQVEINPNGRLFIWGDTGRSMIFEAKAS